MAVSSNIFNNVVDITASALDSVKNNCKMASRVARRWDGDFKGSQKIGDTMNIRIPGFYNYRSGAGANPSGYNDSYIPVVLAQGGAEILLSSKELTLNLDDFKKNVVEPLMAPVFQKIDKSLADQTKNFNQFYGTVGTAITTTKPFLDAKAVMATQSAVPQDGKLSGLLNEYMQASMVSGMAAVFNPTKEISDQYRTGSIGSFGEIDFFATANAPTLVLGTWSGSVTVDAGPADGGNALTLTGQTGSYAVGECLTIAGVLAVNPQGKDTCAELKQFTVVTSSNGNITVSPACYLTGPLQNVSKLPANGDAIYMWGQSAGTALAAGTGQIVKTSAVFHEDAIALAIGDIVDVSGFGGASSTRMKDDQSGLRCRSLFWYNGMDDSALFRIDVLFGSSPLRLGYGSRVIS